MKGELIRGKKRPKRRYKIANPRRFYSFVAAVLLLSIGGTKAITAIKPNHAIVEQVTNPQELEDIMSETEEVEVEEIEEPVVANPIQDVTILYTTDRVYIREFPNTSCETLTLLAKGTKIITEGKYDNDWYIVNYNGQKAYINANYVEEKTIQKFTATKEVVEKYGYNYNPELFNYYVELVASKEVKLRQGPSTDSRTFTTIKPGTHLEVLGQDGDWYIAKFFDMTVYVNSSYANLGIGKKPKTNIKKVGYTTIQTIAFQEPDNQIDSFYVADKEFVEIYDEIGDYYLVKTTDGVGYILKSTVRNIKKINNLLIVVDISSNTMTAYKQKEDGTIEMTLEAPTITGKPGHETPLGLAVVHKIYNYLEDGERHILRGQDGGKQYEVPVDYCIKLLYIKDGKTIEAAVEGEEIDSSEGKDYGINIHTSSDAEDQYGGDKYKSHGCIRTTDYAAKTLTSETEKGDLTYIKR